MSAADIPIASELSLMRDSFASDLQSAEQDFRSWADRLGGRPIEIPIRLNTSDLQQQIQQAIQSAMGATGGPAGGGIGAHPGLSGLQQQVFTTSQQAAQEWVQLAFISQQAAQQAARQVAASSGGPEPVSFEGAEGSYGTYSGGPRAPGGGGGGRGGGLGSMQGLNRYLGAGYLLRETLRVGQHIQELDVNTALAGGDPAQLAHANLNFARQIGSVPIFGQAASLIADPGGTQRAGIESTLREAAAQDAVGEGFASIGSRTAAMQARAAESADVGQVDRRRIAARENLRQENERITTESREQSERISKQAGTQRASIQSSVGLGAWLMASEDDRKDLEFSAAQTTQVAANLQTARLNRQTAIQRAAAQTTFQNETRDLERQDTRLLSDIGAQAHIAQLRMQGRNDEAAVLETRERGIQGQRAARERGGIAAEQAYEPVRLAQEQTEREDIERRRNLRNTQADIAIGDIHGTTRSMELRAGGFGQQAQQEDARRAIDDRVALLKAEAAATRDTAEQSRLNAQAKALEADAGKRAAAMSAEMARANQMQADAIGNAANVTSLEAAGRGREAFYAGTIGQTNLQLEAIGNDPAKQGIRDAIVAREAAQIRLYERRRQDTIRSVEGESQEQRLRTAGRTSEADAHELNRRMHEELAQHADDPEMRRAIADRYSAQIEAARRGSRITARDPLELYTAILNAPAGGRGRETWEGAAANEREAARQADRDAARQQHAHEGGDAGGGAVASRDFKDGTDEFKRDVKDFHDAVKQFNDAVVG